MDVPVPSWKQEAERELKHASRALREGNDGRARACARRAVGRVIAEFNRLRPGTAIAGRSAVDMLRTLASTATIPERVQKAATRLVTNVNRRLSPDFTLHPVNDARIVISFFEEEIRRCGRD